MNNERIPQEVLARVRCRMCRRLGALAVQCMADTDTSFEELAVRLGMPTEKVKGWVYRLISGLSIKLDQVSDLFFAMGCELQIRAVRSDEQWFTPAGPEQPEIESTT